MTIVATGFGLDLLRTGPVVFGYTLKFGPGPITPQILNSSIENWYVVDYRVKRRRPLTACEWQLLREFVQVRDRQAQRQRRARAAERQLREELAKQHVTIDSYAPRLNAPGNYSGLQPVKRAVGNPTRKGAIVAGDGRSRNTASRSPDLRQRFRGQPERKAGPGGPDAPLRTRAGAGRRDRRHPQERLPSRRA